jgi:LysM repeat protein
MLATMLPPSYETKGTGTTEDTSRGESTTDVKSKDMEGNEITIEVETETGEDKSTGETTERASNTMNLPKGLTEHLGFKSAEIKEDETKGTDLASSNEGNDGSSQDGVRGQVLPVPEQVSTDSEGVSLPESGVQQASSTDESASEIGRNVEDKIFGEQHETRLRRREMAPISNQDEDSSLSIVDAREDTSKEEPQPTVNSSSVPGVVTRSDSNVFDSNARSFEVEERGHPGDSAP